MRRNGLLRDTGRVLTVLLVLTGLVAMGGVKARAQDACLEAKRLYNQALGEPDPRAERALYQKALSLGCDDPTLLGYIHNNLGDISEREGDLDTALREYRKAESYLPRHETILENLAHLFQRLGRTEEAKTYYERLYEAKREIPAGRIVAGLSLERRLRSIKIVPVAAPVPSRPPASLPSVTLYFDFDSARLRPGTLARLDTLLKALKDPEISDHRFLLAGHTCSLGTEDYNMGLSIRRAKSVRDWLVKNGISPDRLEVKGYGETRPIMSNKWEYTRRFNRRVEVKTIGIISPVVRGIVTAKVAEARALIKKGQDLMSQGRCREATACLERAVRLLEGEEAPVDLNAAKRNLLLGYLCEGNMEKLKGLTPDE